MTSQSNDLHAVPQKTRRRRILYFVIGMLAIGYVVGAYGFISYLTTASTDGEPGTLKVAGLSTDNSPTTAELDAFVAEALANEESLRIDWEHDRRAEPQDLNRRPEARIKARQEEIKNQLKEAGEFPEGSIEWSLQQRIDE